MLTLDELTEVMPMHLKSQATTELVDKVNKISADPDFNAEVKKNFVSYTQVLKEGKFKTSDYLNAVAYVTLKIMGFTNKDSYMRTFPDRYSALVARGANDKEISAYVASYNKNKLVNLIFEQTYIASWVLNQDVYQKAINTQAELMMTANSEKVRSDAANSILTHLKKPEDKHIELNIGVADNSGMNELKDMLGALAQRQQDLIAQGVPTIEIAHQKLGSKTIESSAKDITPKAG